MKYHLESIASQLQTPESFIAECEKEYAEKVRICAEKLIEKTETASIILLAGPSGSGKTTTANKLREAVRGMGHDCQVVSMDDYFRTVSLKTHPRDADGNIDYESPLCLDIPLFKEHIYRLHNGETVKIPHFDFPNQRRHADMFTELNIPKGGMCIFEGIHALNPMFSEGINGFAQKVYVSARADIKIDSKMVFKGTWVRFVRRMIRDNNFRGWEPSRTMDAWGSVRNGEKTYISPFKESAEHKIDTHMQYEMCMLRDVALPMLKDVPQGCHRELEIKSILPALEKFPSINLSLLPEQSLLHEFLG